MFKFQDTDIFPFPCPKCGEKLSKPVGWLKQNARLTCDGCETKAWFHQEDFLRALKQAERAINDFGRSIQYGQPGA